MSIEDYEKQQALLELYQKKIFIKEFSLIFFHLFLFLGMAIRALFRRLFLFNFLVECFVAGLAVGMDGFFMVPLDFFFLFEPLFQLSGFFVAFGAALYRIPVFEVVKGFATTNSFFRPSLTSNRLKSYPRRRYFPVLIFCL